MPIQLDNAQYNAFVSFALGANDENAIAHAAGAAPADPLAGRTISARTGDSVHAFTRLARTDWSRFDFEAFQRAGDDGGTDEQIAQIPEPFRLHARITASVHFELNAAPARQNVHA